MSKTFYRGNVDELSALRAVMKKPALSRPEQAEVLRARLESVLDDAAAAGFKVRVSIVKGDTLVTPLTIRMIDTRGAV